MESYRVPPWERPWERDLLHRFLSEHEGEDLDGVAARAGIPAADLRRWAEAGWRADVLSRGQMTVLHRALGCPLCCKPLTAPRHPMMRGIVPDCRARCP